ncbi:outer membrane beta-barrel protein [Bradyrhizobium niftali]|uniref:Omptin family outer membrane protease n=1 Tax=Bradyrhizobium niftali TaxID=2560055 RepID=A0A4Y9LEN9_9BRAD|nr:outer membrane beta-barrel protein [Bradyrhizobium niftali]TFV41376.1 omptin family outer membrane protease [Bradyrhizobium niftali]
MRSALLFWGATTIALVASGAATSADLEPSLQLPPAVWSWSGGYIGGHLGGGYGRTSFSNPYGPPIYGDIIDTPVFLAGGQIGYNWQKNSWVFGVQLDASGAVSDGTNTCLAASSAVVSANCKAGPNVFATGTGRMGYAFGPQGRTLAYIKGGLAWQNNQGDVVNNYELGWMPQETTHFAYGRVGGIIGLGVEQALTPAWSVTAEYDYLHFGGPKVETPPTVQLPPFAILPANTTSLSSNYHIGKIGLNYHFGTDPWTAQWGNAPLSAKAPTGAPPMAYTPGWSFEGGSRLWLSRGRFQWDHSAVASGRLEDPSILISRLTYHGLDGFSGELFGRLDSPWGIFLKSNVGTGRFNKGNMNDEDWAATSVSYANTISGQANGRFTYYTADLGYDFLRGANYKVGGFIGWTYYAQSSDTIGCVQIANPMYRCPASADQIVGSQDTQWNAPRIGLSAETMLTERWRLSTDVAYLPWIDFKGRDNHLLRDLTTFDEQRGTGGGGAQIEGVLSYFITKNFSIGVGGRYWAMWTEEHSNSTCKGSDCFGASTGFAKFSMERWGTFFQASYKLN